MIKEIEFKQTSNIFLNSGIIGLYIYLEKIQRQMNEGTRDDFPFEYSYKLKKNSLIIQSDDLYGVLEEIYYIMGKEIYDTSSSKAREKQDKYYFIEKPFRAIPFYKMKTYGLGELITNDPTPVAGKNGEKIKFTKLFNENEAFALKIAEFLNKNGKQLTYFTYENKKLFKNPVEKINGKEKVKKNAGGESEVFINSPYTKTTPLPPYSDDYFIMGNESCYLTGEMYKKTLETQNTSPFISGILNFESHLKTASRKISWKSMYLSRFAPKLCFYMYIDGLDSLTGYFFNSNNLKNSLHYYKLYSTFFKSEQELIEDNYMANFKLYNFYSEKKSEDEKIEKNTDFGLNSEILFMLIFTFYKKFLFQLNISEIDKIFEQFKIQFENKPLSIIQFKADKFAKTLRPNVFEEFNNFKLIIQLLFHLETKSNIQIKDFLHNLKFLKKSDSGNDFINKRKIRNKILSKILKLKSITKDIVNLFYLIFLYKLKNEDKTRRFLKPIFDFTINYEQITKFGGNIHMNKEIQEKAINLGTSIGISILNFDNDTNKQDNAKAGRKYIISLNKARNIKQFMDEIIRIQFKYKVVTNTEILKEINDQNWEEIKRFVLISALNRINSIFINDNGDKSKKGASNE